MTTYPNMGLTLPTRGAGGSGLWGDTDDANWAKVDAHDHTSGKGLQIPTAGLNINADLPFSSLWAPTQLHRVQFSAIAGGALTSGQRKSLFVSDGTGGLVANELYWLNASGNKVQFTSGNTLNFSAFVGGIGGDYSSVGAQLNYVDAQKGYEFKEGTSDSNHWARLRSGDLRLFPFNGAGAIFVGMAAPGAIAGSYTVTWPLALPGTSNLVAIDNTGQVAFSNTISQAVTLSGGATVGAQFLVTGTISPPALTDSLTHNDYNPSGLATANVIRQAVSGSSSPVLSGLAGGTDGRRLVLVNLGATSSDHIQLNHEDAGSAAANRFSVAGAGSLTLTQFGAVILAYDGTSSRWRVVGKSF